MRRHLTQELHNLIERGRDRQLRLAVTGLSRAGKTAFLTSLVHQLRHAGLEARLDLLRAAREGRLLGAQRVAQPDLGVPRFPYDAAMAALDGTPPQWPAPTRGISELRLTIKHRTRRARGLLGDTATLTLDLIDYPGEWLLDLPLLEHDFLSWCEAQQATLGAERQRLSAAWLQAAGALSPDDTADESHLAEVAAHYATALRASREAGFADLQPGRFLLPGDLEDAPVLQFFPLPDIGEAQRAELEALPGSSVYKTLARRFDHYRRHVVKPFYRDHFRRFDRQIVLVDVLGALNAGPERFEDLSRALGTLMRSFDYGKRSLLNRLFSPRIDRLAIAATKADHVTPEQHSNVVALLEALLAEPLKDLRYADVPVKALSLASVSATEPRDVEHEGRRRAALRGTTLEGEDVLLFPGDVPPRLPAHDFWARQGFAFTAFRPPQRDTAALPHVRMDAALDWLIGDKLT
ncbi:YcjX family protein [Chromohalobacter sp.]|uniref:YcjX family protein n=1 Tax=Chromohalobacter sp. TaxID=50740 RepID=UPI001DAA64F3|nr:YcjX family protein [Chromohalobacter sp.]NQY44763.1 YcjX family protein [Chromohalobacter sp.]